MSEIKEIAVTKEQKELETDGSEWIWPFLILAICFSGWGNSESSRISELEKKVSRLEGQMSMIGGKSL